MAGARGLLAFMNVLWLVQSSLPLLDRRVPSLFSLPLSQILALVLGVAVAVCANNLLGALNGGGRPLGANTRSIFSVLSGLWATGVGVHACANAVEKELTEEDHALYPLVHDHLHELWSHQMLQSAYLGLLLLLLWTETASGPENHDQFHRERSPLYLLVEIAWLIALGVAFATIGRATETVFVTIAFFLTVLAKSGRLTLSKATTSLSVSCATGLCVMFVLLIN